MVNKLCTISDNAWLRFVKISIVTGMIIGIVMSFHLWIGDRLLPVLPMMEFYVPQWMNFTLVVAFVVAMLATCVSNRREAPTIVILSGAALIFLDQLRLQPWVYLYLLLLIPFALGGSNRNGISTFYLIAIAGIYVWSGIHKLNIYFLDGNYAANLQLILGYKIKSDSDVFRTLGYSVGLIEMSIGIGLLFDYSRRIAISGATLMHLLIITFVTFQPAVGDSIVIPWNITMIVLNAIVFYPIRSPFRNPGSVGHGSKITICFGVIIVWLCPALNFVGRWDHFPSFSLYSNKFSMFYVAIHQDDLDKIDHRLWRYFVHLPGLTGGQILDVHWWSEDELNIPFYPEKRTFMRLSSYFCGLGIPDSHIVFLELAGRDSSASVINSFSCSSPGNTLKARQMSPGAAPKPSNSF